MSVPETLTVRNLSTRELTLSRIERYKRPPSKPEPPKLKNITNVANLTHNLTSFLSKTPLAKTPVQGYLPTPGPENSRLDRSPSTPPIWTRDGDYKVPPFVTRTPEGENEEIRLWKDSKDEIFRLIFQVDNFSRKYFVDINPQAKGVKREVVTLEGDDKVPYHAIWHIAHSHLTLYSTPTPVSYWQQTLPNWLPLSALSLPGTHNSPTCFVAAPSVRCQAQSITSQLENGIRFFDVRAQPDLGSSTLWLVHGSFPISLSGKQYLDRLLEDTYAFLDRNPSETVIISLKREGPFEATDEQFSKILYERYIDGHWREKWYTLPLIPSLEQARGKCVLIRRFKLDPSLQKKHTVNGVEGWGINAEAWKYNTPNSVARGGQIIVQDFCEVIAQENVDTKIKFIKEHIGRASAATYSHVYNPDSDSSKVPFYVNFLSASNFWNVKCWPEKIAEKVNPAVREYLCREHEMWKGDGGTGVVVADWVGEKGDWDMVSLVVAVNGLLIVRDRERREREEREEKGRREREERERREQEEREQREQEEREAREKQEAEERERIEKEAQEQKERETQETEQNDTQAAEETEQQNPNQQPQNEDEKAPSEGIALAN